MPRRALKGCNYAGCPALIERGRYCAEHQRRGSMSADMQRGSASARGYDARWRQLRARVIARDPICVDPYGIHAVHHEVALSTDADHVIPRSEGGEDSMENLQGLCHSCHSRKTALQSSGWGGAQKNL